MQRAYLTVKEVAEQIGVGTGRVYQMIGEGLIPAVKVGRSVRIPTAAWEEWLDNQARAAREEQEARKRAHHKEV